MEPKWNSFVNRDTSLIIANHPVSPQLFVNNTINSKSHCFLTLTQNIKLLLNNIKDNRLESRSPSKSLLFLDNSKIFKRFFPDFSQTTSRLLPWNSQSLPRLAWDWSRFKSEILNMVPCLVMGWEKGTYYSLVTPKLLPDYFQNNACLLSVYSLVISRLLPDESQTTP